MPSLREELGKRNPFSAPEEEAVLNIVRTASILECQSARLLKRSGLSGSTYNILRILRGEERAGSAGTPMQVIGERLVAQVPDVTRLVDRLERASLVKRARTSHDRRLVLVRITRKGLALIDQLDGPLLELHRQQLGHMTRSELAELSRLLVKARHPAQRDSKETS